MLGYVGAVWLVAVVGGYLPFAVATVIAGKRNDSGGSSSSGGGRSDNARNGTGTAWISVLNVLSGGIFIAAGFMHLLPQAEEALRHVSSEWNFQFAPFFASLGFVVIFVLEELVRQASLMGNPFASFSSSMTFYGRLNDSYDDVDGFNAARNRQWRGVGNARTAAGNSSTAAGNSSTDYDDYSAYGSFGATEELGGGAGVGRGAGITAAGGVTGAAIGSSGTTGGLGRGTTGLGRTSSTGLGWTTVGKGGIAVGSRETDSRGPPGFSAPKRNDSSGAPGAATSGGLLRRAAELHGLNLGLEDKTSISPVVTEVRLGEDGGGSGHPMRLELPLQGGGTSRWTNGMRQELPLQGGNYGAATAPSGFARSAQGVKPVEEWSVNAGTQLLFPHETTDSPVRAGQGPWIGRRLSAAELERIKQEREQEGEQERDQERDSFSVARSWGVSLVDKYRLRHLSNHDGAISRPGKDSDTAGAVYSTNMGLILGVVLSFHAVMEGLGAGASSPSSAVGIFSAIIVHKGLAAFSLGCMFYSSDASRFQYFCYMTIFSVLTPLGALAGMAVRQKFSGSAGAGVCTALGAGTFLNVAAMEVLPRDLFNDTRMKGTKLACLVGGYLAFAGLSLYI